MHRMQVRFQSPLVSRLACFIQDVGLKIQSTNIAEPTFLPGLTVFDGSILVDESRLLYPGDLLHEAGHLAVLPSSEREHVSAPLDGDAGMEMAAIAWSYAALRHLEIDPKVVFHEAGYKDGSQALIDNFAARRFIGVPLLQWMGMTTEKDYPMMSQWLRPVASEAGPVHAPATLEL